MKDSVTSSLRPAQPISWYAFEVRKNWFCPGAG